MSTEATKSIRSSTAWPPATASTAGLAGGLAAAGFGAGGGCCCAARAWAAVLLRQAPPGVAIVAVGFSKSAGRPQQGIQAPEHSSVGGARAASCWQAP